jgi:hypothetical protein
LPSVVEAWHTPPFPEFEPRTAWSLFNAFTCRGAANKGAGAAIQRGHRLHALMDGLFSKVDFEESLLTMPA